MIENGGFEEFNNIVLSTESRLSLKPIITTLLAAHSVAMTHALFRESSPKPKITYLCVFKHV